MLIKEAYEKLNAQQYDKALVCFQQIMEKFGKKMDDSGKALIHRELALLHFWMADYVTASDHARQLLKIKGGDVDTAYEILMKIAIAEFKFQEAQQYCQKMNKDNSQQALGYCLIAIKCRNLKRAEFYLEVLSKRQFFSPEVRLYQAYCQLLRGSGKGAIIEARALMKVFARSPAHLLIIAEIFMTAGEYSQASGLCERILVQCPGNDQALAIMAHTAYAQEDFAQAGKFAHDALRKNPANAYAKTVLMKLAVRDGDYVVAEQMGKDIITASPEYSLGHANLGDIYFDQGRYDLARIEYQHTEELMQTQTKGSLLRQARMKFIDEDYKAAVEILKGMVDSYHSYYDEACCDLVLCYEQLGDEQKKKEVTDKMKLRKVFFHRTQQVMQKIGDAA